MLATFSPLRVLRTRSETVRGGGPSSTTAGPVCGSGRRTGWLTGFEPATSWTTTRRSTRLSYSHRGPAGAADRRRVYLVPPGFPTAVRRVRQPSTGGAGAYAAASEVRVISAAIARTVGVSGPGCGTSIAAR